MIKNYTVKCGSDDLSKIALKEYKNLKTDQDIVNFLDDVLNNHNGIFYINEFKCIVVNKLIPKTSVSKRGNRKIADIKILERLNHKEKYNCYTDNEGNKYSIQDLSDIYGYSTSTLHNKLSCVKKVSINGKCFTRNLI